MIGREQVFPLESTGQLIPWADRVTRFLKTGDPNLDGAEVTNPQITADQANYRLDRGLLFRFTTDASRTVHGFIGGTAARLAAIANVGAQPLVIADQSATAQAANRIITGTGANVTLNANETGLLQYDSQSGRWRLVGKATGGGGATPHNLLSTTHPDTDPISPPTRGDLIVANATPLWARFAIGAADRFLGSNGTDPAWVAPGALTRVDDTNVTLVLGGTPATALLRATSLTLGWTGQLAIARGGTSAGTALGAFNALSPLTTRGDLLTRDVTNNIRLAIGAADRFLGSDGIDPAWTAPGALTRVDDTNVTLALGGTPTTALLRATSLTLGWTGTLAIARGGTASGTALGAFNNLSPLTTRGDLLTRDVTNNIRLAIGAADRFLGSNGTDPLWTAPGALTRVDDTNVTLVLGGTPTTALLRATSLTLGWTGTLAIARGGTAAGTALGAFNNLSPLTTRGDLLTRDATNNIRLAIGAAGRFFRSDGVDGSWQLIADGDVPNTITLDNITQITTRSHASLQNLVAPADDHTQYGHLPGRAGGQAFNGGTAAADHFDIFPNTAAFLVSNAGRIRLFGQVQIFPSALTNPGAPLRGMVIGNGATWTSAGDIAQGLVFNPTFAWSAAPFFGLLPQVFVGQPLFSLDFTNTIFPAAMYYSQPTYDVKTGRTVTVSDTAAAGGFYDGPTWTRTGTGVYDAAAAYNGYISQFLLSGGASFNLRRAFRVIDAVVSGGGALAQQVGIEIPALANATLNVGLRNASIEVDTPLVSTITAVGSTISRNARCVRLDNTSGGALTLTSAPTIADGQDGQLLAVFNGSANGVTIQDQGTLAGSNLRLSTATFAIGQRDSILLMYSATVGDWVEIARTNVI